MPRSRMVRPETFSDEKLATVSREARYLFIGLWVTSDDYGVTKGHPAWLRSQIFPYDPDVSIPQIEGWLRDLSDSGRIIPFVAEAELYFNIPNFLRHQKIHNPSQVRNPSLASGSQVTPEEIRAPRVETETESETETEVKRKRKSPPKPGAVVVVSDHKLAVDYWHETYLNRIGTKYSFQKKDFQLVKNLLNAFTLEQFCCLADYILTTDEDPWIADGRRTIGTLSFMRNTIIQRLKNPAKKQSGRTAANMQALHDYLTKAGLDTPKNSGGTEL